MKKIIFLLLTVVTIHTNAQTIQTSALYTEGRKIMDSCGEEIILIGVNLGNMWEYNFGIDAYPEIKKTGANAVRIALTTSYQDWSNGGQWTSLTNAQLESMIAACIENNMIPIVTLHDWTATNNSSATNSLPLATAWWTDAGRLSILKKYQRYLILNIANEPENGITPQADYYQANKNAVMVLRSAGLNCPIMIDSYEWGHAVSFTNIYGPQLISDDPLHRLVFSIHAYWPAQWYTDAEIESMISSMYDANIPYVFGELAAYNGDVAQPISYQLIMEKTAANKFGWQAWWWGFENPGANNVLSMTTNGDSSGLAGFGLEIAIANPYSIKNRSVTPQGLINGGCTTGLNDIQRSPEFDCYPNPAVDHIVIESKEAGNITVIDITGRELTQFPIKKGQQQITLPGFWTNGWYLFKMNGTSRKLQLQR